MSKAILVLDEMPESCDKCRLSDYYCGDQDEGERNCLVEPHVDDLADCTNIPVHSYYTECIKPDWCPLKELPEKIDQDEGDFKSGFWYQCGLGWNLCIDEILDGTEN